MTYVEGYSVHDGMIFTLNEDAEEEAFCEEICLLEDVVNVSNGMRKWVVGVVQSDGGIYRVEGTPASLLRDPIGTLANYGLHLIPTPEYNLTLSEILLDMAPATPLIKQHHDLGFADVDGQRVFLSRKMLGHSTSNSTHTNAERLAAKGSVDDWIAGVSNLCSGRPEIQLALAIAVVAPIAALLKESATLDITPVYALVGESSSGKTTMLKLIASVWGKPVVGDGVIGTMNCTPTYFFDQLSHRRGFPMLLDDTSNVPNLDFTSILYDIANSQEKGTCPGGVAKTPRTWSGAVIFTGERSLLAQTNGNEGLYARALELTFPWTVSREEADRIADFVDTQHGTAHVPVIEYLLNLDNQTIKKCYHAWHAFFVEEVEASGGVEIRAAKLCAVVLTAAQVLGEVLAIPMDYWKLTELLATAYKATLPEVPLAERLHGLILAWIAAHADRFPDAKDLDEGRNGLQNQGVWGKRGFHQEKASHCVYVSAEELECMLADKGYRDSTYVYRALHDIGKIRKYSGSRFKKGISLGTVPNVQCVCIYTDAVIKPKPVKKQTHTHINRDFLISEDR